MWTLSPSQPGASSYRVAPILASSGRQKIRRRESASSTSQGASANRFWRCIVRTSVALAVVARRTARRRRPDASPGRKTASSPPEPWLAPRRSAREPEPRLLRLSAGRRTDELVLADTELMAADLALQREPVLPGLAALDDLAAHTVPVPLDREGHGVRDVEPVADPQLDL